MPIRRTCRPEKIYAADLFCGAGGFSSGLLLACRELGIDVELVAINHWPTAIETHSRNHPNVRHICKSIEGINPRIEIASGMLHVLCASPECVHFSNARGGRPMSDQSRATAWHVLHWLETLDVHNLVIENVREFRSWGPLHPCRCGAEDEARAAGKELSKVRHEKGYNCYRPVEKHKGRYYRMFLSNLRGLGYRVEDRVLCAADYGDATTRERLFLLAKKGRRKIIWPKPTHVNPKLVEERERTGQILMFEDDRKPWRPAREIIDWSLEGTSIYDRRKPLAPNTMARIFAGLKRYSGIPFLVPQFGERDGQEPRTHSIDHPLPAATSHGAGALVAPEVVGDVVFPTADRLPRDPITYQPYLVVLRNHADAVSLDEPTPAICAGGNHLYLAQPEGFLLQTTQAGSNGSCTYPLERPAPTMTTRQELAFVQPEVEPFLLPHQHGNDTLENVRSVEQPLGAVTGTSSDMFLARPEVVEFEELPPYVVRHFNTGTPYRSVEEPLPTVAAQFEHNGLAQPCIIPTNHGAEARVHSVERPMPCITGFDSLGVAIPEVTPFTLGTGGPVGAGAPRSVEEPVGSILTENHTGVAVPELPAGLQGVQPGDLMLVPPYLIEYHGGEDHATRTRSVEDPLATQTTANRFGLVQAFLVKYYGTADEAQSVEEPLDTITAKDRFALVTAAFLHDLPRLPEVRQYEVLGRVVGYLDIKFRMLTPAELAAAMSFPPDYDFAGNREEQVKQVGNAVAVQTAKALCAAALA